MCAMMRQLTVSDFFWLIGFERKFAYKSMHRPNTSQISAFQNLTLPHFGCVNDFHAFSTRLSQGHSNDEPTMMLFQLLSHI